jgi:hypothetical protein
MFTADEPWNLIWSHARAVRRMSHGALWMALAACTHMPSGHTPLREVTNSTPTSVDTSSSVQWDPVRPGETYLIDGFETKFKRRAFLTHAHKLAWSRAESSPNSPPTSPKSQPVEPVEDVRAPVVVVERQREDLRIVLDASGIYVTGYLPRIAFGEATVTDALVLPSRDHKPTSPHGVKIKPGYLLKSSDERSYEIRDTVDSFRIEGVINGSSVGTVFTPVEAPNTGEQVEIDADASLLDGPKGRRIATTPNRTIVSGRIIESRSGMAHIIVETHWLKIDAWVQRAHVRTTETRIRVGHGSGGGGGGSHTLSLYRDSLVRATPAGPIVARVHHHRVVAFDYGKDGRHHRVGLLLPWPIKPSVGWITEAELTRSTQLDAVRSQRIKFVTSAATGTDRSAIQALVKARRWAFNSCLDKALRKHPTLSGRLAFDVSLGPTASATAPLPIDDTPLQQLAKCVQSWLVYRSPRGTQIANAGEGQVILQFESGESILKRQSLPPR